MLDTQTKKRIDDCRDILVGKLPDPKAQIEQITIGLIYKFMDDMDKEAIELGASAKFFSGDYEKYAWNKLFDTKVTAAEMLRLYSEAVESMEKNPNIPQLFRDIFKNAYLPYRDPETLKLFLKTIGEFEYTHSEKLGDAFEYLLSVMGSQGDAGQFRTPRHVIDFITAIIDPDKGESILDPACGTAGFLISAYKHILLKYTKANKEALNIYEYNKLEKKPFNNLGDQLTPDDRKKLIQKITGYDISPDMVRLSLVNLYLHGFSNPHIHEYDTLSSEERWNENADVILANPPFMSPKGGIRPHKKFTISSNRSEVLFVDYIAEHLNPKGKAGIIVPEGVIFQSGTAYKALRKMLVENYLYAIVSLPAGVFNPYSGVKTSILFMDKEVAKKRDEILFIKIDNDGYNLGAQRTSVKGSQLEEAIALLSSFRHSGLDPESLIAHAVLKTEIAANGDYNLSGERYKIGAVHDTEYDFVALNEIAEFTQLGLVKNKQEQGEKNEKYPFPYIKMDAIDWNGQLDLNKVSFVNASEEELKKLTLDDGDFIYNTRNAPNLVGKCAVYHGKAGTYLFNNNILRIKFNRKKANPDFVNRVLVSDNGKLRVQNLIAGTTSVAAIYQKEYLSIQIPLPPISIQEEIVAEIEGYQNIIDGAKAVTANYKPKIDIDPDWEMVEFADAPFEIIDGDRGKNYPNGDDFSPEGYCLFLNTKNVRDNGFRFDDVMFISKEKDELLRKGKLQREDVLLTTRGTIGNTAYYDASVPYDNIRINSGMLIFRPNDKDLLPEYLYYFFQSENCESQFKKIISGAAQPQLPIRSLKNAIIPLPDIETQRQIVAQIEKEQELVNANKQLIEIFEQKIKDRIAKVWGTSTSSEQEKKH